MADSGTYDPETVARHQRIADTLLKQAAAPREIRSRLQGVGQLGEGLIAGLESGWADKETKDARAAMIAQGLQAYGIGGAAPAAAPIAPVSAGDQSQPATTLVGNNPQIPASGGGDPASAIANIESGGRYDLVGPATRGDRPYGKYQVMGANIPAWTKEHLGQALTPQQFLASPEAQDAVFKGQFGKYAQKYGPEGAARAWFAGEGGMNNPNARDILGTTVSSYADKFNKGIGGPPVIAAALNAPPSAPPPVQVVSADAGPASFADRFAAANGARPPAAPPMAAPPPVAAALNAPPPQQTPSPAGGAPGVAAALNAPVQVAQNAPQQGSREAQVRFGLNPWTPPAAASAVLGQLTPKPQAMKITNRDGSESIVFVDPNKGTITGAGGKPVDTESGPPNPTLSGDDYLKSIPTGRRELITGMLEGRIGPAQLGRYGTKQVQSLLEDAARVEPNFDLTTWKGREAGIKDFYGGGKSQQTVRALNQSALHFGELVDKMPALPGHAIPSANAAENFVKTQLFGKDAAPNFELNAHALADELATIFKGAGISDSEIRSWESRITPNMSDEQQRGMAKTILGLYRDAFAAQEKKRQDSLGPTLAGRRERLIGPEAESALTRIEKFTGGQSVGGAPQAPIKVSSPEEARKLPKGTAIILPDGSPGVVP